MNRRKTEALAIQRFGLLDVGKSHADIEQARARVCHDLLVNLRGSEQSLAIRPGYKFVASAIVDSSTMDEVAPGDGMYTNEEWDGVEANGDKNYYFNAHHKTSVLFYDPADANKIIVGVLHYKDGSGGATNYDYVRLELYHSTNGGQTWDNDTSNVLPYWFSKDASSNPGPYIASGGGGSAFIDNPTADYELATDGTYLFIAWYLNDRDGSSETASLFRCPLSTFNGTPGDKNASLVTLGGPYTAVTGRTTEWGNACSLVYSDGYLYFTHTDTDADKITRVRKSTIGGVGIGTAYNIAVAGKDVHRAIVQHDPDNGLIYVASHYGSGPPDIVLFESDDTTIAFSTPTETIVQLALSSVGFSYRFIPELSGSADSGFHCFAAITNGTTILKAYVLEAGGSTIASGTVSTVISNDDFDLVVAYNNASDKVFWWLVVMHDASTGANALVKMKVATEEGISSTTLTLTDDVTIFDETATGGTPSANLLGVNAAANIVNNSGTYTLVGDNVFLLSLMYQVTTGEYYYLDFTEVFDTITIRAMIQTWLEHDSSSQLTIQASNNELYKLDLTNGVPVTFTDLEDSVTTVFETRGCLFAVLNSIIRACAGNGATNDPVWYGHIKREYFLDQDGADPTAPSNTMTYDRMCAQLAHLIKPQSGYGQIESGLATDEDDNLGRLSRGIYKYRIAFQYDGFQYSLPGAETTVDLAERSVPCRAADTDDVTKGWCQITTEKAHGCQVDDDVYITGTQFSKTLAAVAVADLGGSPNQVRLTTSAVHSFLAGDTVTITGTTNYDGTYVITNINSTTTFDIYHSYTAETPAGTETVLNYCYDLSYKIVSITSSTEFVIQRTYRAFTFPAVAGAVLHIKRSLAAGNALPGPSNSVGLPYEGDRTTFESSYGNDWDVPIVRPIGTANYDGTDLEVSHVDENYVYVYDSFVVEAFDGTEILESRKKIAQSAVVDKTASAPVLAEIPVSEDHRINAGDIVRIDGTTSFDGSFTVDSVSTDTIVIELTSAYPGDETLSTSDTVTVLDDSTSPRAIGVRVSLTTASGKPKNPRITGVALLRKFIDQQGETSIESDWRVVRVAPCDEGSNTVVWTGKADWVQSTTLLNVGKGIPAYQFNTTSATIIDDYMFVKLYVSDSDIKIGRITNVGGSGGQLTVSFTSAPADGTYKYEIINRWRYVTGDNKAYHVFVDTDDALIQSFEDLAGFDPDLDSIDANYPDRCSVNGWNFIAGPMLDPDGEQEVLEDTVFYSPQTGDGQFSEDVIDPTKFIKFGRDGDYIQRIVPHSIGSDDAGTAATDVLAIIKQTGVYLVNVAGSPVAWQQIRRYTGKGAINRDTVFKRDTEILMLDLRGVYRLRGLELKTVESFDRLGNLFGTITEAEKQTARLGYVGEQDLLLVSFPDKAGTGKLFIHDEKHDEWGEFRFTHNASIMCPGIGINSNLGIDLSGRLFFSNGSDVYIYPNGTTDAGNTFSAQWISKNFGAETGLTKSIIHAISAAHYTVPAGYNGSLIVRNESGTQIVSLTLVSVASAKNHPEQAQKRVLSARATSFEIEFNVASGVTRAELDSILLEVEQAAAIL